MEFRGLTCQFAAVFEGRPCRKDGDGVPEWEWGHEVPLQLHRSFALLTFDWDTDNIGHIARHDVTVAEVEYVLEHPTLDYGYQAWHEEERFAEVGSTAQGRVLMVITTWRGLDIRVVTAFDADRESREEYLRRR